MSSFCEEVRDALTSLEGGPLFDRYNILPGKPLLGRGVLVEATPSPPLYYDILCFQVLPVDFPPKVQLGRFP